MEGGRERERERERHGKGLMEGGRERETWKIIYYYMIVLIIVIPSYDYCDHSHFIDDHEEGWRCPGCQNSSNVIPSVYKCFCGRVINPNERRGRGDLTVPHSCGELCHRKLASSDQDNCRHKCHQLCHPGPCPPCPVTVLRHCPCGKTR